MTRSVHKFIYYAVTLFIIKRVCKLEEQSAQAEQLTVMSQNTNIDHLDEITA